MKSVDKGLFPSKSAASPKFSSTGFEENDENDSGQDNMTPKSQNYTKTVAKHFMSPTISAASKAASPRNKILAERNENWRSSGSQSRRMSNPDWKRSTRNSSDRFPSRIVDGDTKAYDPVKNFLSPRPKYLRFDPNRRREIFKRLRKEELKRSFESLDVSGEEESSAEETDCSSFCQESDAELKIWEKSEEDEDMIDDDDDDDDDDEEEEEERGWCLRGLFEFLFVLIGCALSTSYICSMNSPTPSQTQQEIWNGRDGCLISKNQTLDFVGMNLKGNGFFDVEVGDKYSRSEDVLIEESFETQIVENIGRHDVELGRYDGSEDSKDGTDDAEFDLIHVNFEQPIAAKSDDIKSNENNVIINKDVDAEIESKEELIGFKMDGSEDVGGYVTAKSDENVDAIDFSCTSSNENNVNKDEGAEIESKVELIGSKTDESEDVGGYVMAMEREAPNEFQNIELSPEPISEDEESTDFVDDDLTDSVNEVDETGYDNEDVKEKTKWTTSVVIGVLVASVISTSVAIVNHSKKGRSTPSEASRPMPKPNMLLVVEEATPLVPCIERKVEFLARPSSLSYPSMQEAPKVMNHHIHAPSVELISEIVVGKVSSSSDKYKMTESKESNATSYAEPASLPHTVSTPIKPSIEEHSSTSHGSFSTGRKISKKEGGEGGEATIGATPVRRSNRLRSRAAVTSP